jgi:uncharacterized protein
MVSKSSRRNFIAAGLSLPAAALADGSSPAKDAIQFRTLGKTGLKVTSVGFGCMITSDPSVVARAVDLGIRYFDTAHSYQGGNNEHMVGAVLKGHRDKLVISSKSDAKTAKEAMEHLDTSLSALHTDHLDIWYMHAHDDPAGITDELMSAWESAKKQGKIRCIGLSTHKPNDVVDRILALEKFEVVLSTYNFAVGNANDEAFQKLQESGIGLVAMKVMAPAKRPFGFDASRSDRLKDPGAPLAALKWVLRNQRFASAIPSMTDADQLAVNFKAMSETFTSADEKLLARVNEEIRPLYCRMCYQCTGQCPNHVPVPEMIRYLSYADFYGQFSLGREHFLALPRAARDIRCSDCHSCQVRCPNGVHVAERLMRAQELFA